MKNPKIGILTLPFNSNYGGILQAYALIHYLKGCGYDTYHIYRDFPEKNKLTQIAKDLIKFMIGRTKKKQIKGRYTSSFFKKYVAPRTHRIRTLSDLKRLKDYQFSTVVVGSDQVWRKACIYGDLKMNYFLDFVDPNTNRVAYAASFGIDEWQYGDDETKEIRREMEKFQAISVREKSGVDLCEKYWGLRAEHVIDPVMLLSVDDYSKMIEKDDLPDNSNDCFVYTLDVSTEKDEIVSNVSQKLGFSTYSIDSNRKVKPRVTEWLKGFHDAKFVVTDSFHGCVFSILFNKPFLVIANKERGIARFSSVLNDFGLLDRMIYSKEENYEKIVSEQIDWEAVNSILAEKRKAAHHFLINAIK